MRKLFLIDGSSYFYRAFFGIRGLRTSSGEPTNAIYGFATMLTKVLRQHKPDYVAMVFDAPGRTFRDDLYPGYKATRQPMPEDLSKQIPAIKELPAAFNVASLEIPGVEADDVIGTLARRAVGLGIDVVILTGDKDFTQLVTRRKDDAVPGIVLYDDMKERWTGVDEVRERFGVDPGGVRDVLALMGDATDNIPGVRGIGEKTAVKLLSKYQRLDRLYASLPEVEERWRKLLEAGRKDALLARDLVTIRTDVPLPLKLEDLATRPPDKGKLAAAYSRFEFQSLLKELGDAALPPAKTISYSKYRTILDHAGLEETARELKAATWIALDTETDQVDPMRARLVGISLCAKEGEGRYIPVGHSYLGAPEQLPVADVLQALRPALTDPAKRLAGQNVKFDAVVLSRAGLELPPYAMDTMVAAYLLNPDREHNLEAICREYLGHQMTVYEDVTGRGARRITFDQVSVETARDYSAEDADVVLRLVPILEDRLRKDGLDRLHRDIEVPLIPVLLDMERAGVRVDAAILKRMSSDFSSRMMALMGRIHASAQEEFNIDSPRQLQRILFEKLKLKAGRRTKTGYSTDVAVLEKLADEHELPRMILEFRQLGKLKSTYLDALVAMIHPETGRVHTSYNQAIAATGRLSSSDPNLQNIPVRTEEGRMIRAAFVPDPGWVFVSADYSQIELRVLAHLCRDPKLTAAFQSDQDVHRATAAEVFEVPPSQVTADQRRKAKEINFGIIYGMSAQGFAQRLGLDLRTAQAYIDRYFARYAKVKAWMGSCLESGRKFGYVSTLLGRRRYVPDLASSNRMVASPAERIAVNAPIQGTAADLMKLAMIAIWKRLRKEKRNARMILQVHDELVVEAPKGEAEAASRILQEEMERVYPLDVPLKVNLAVGDSWAALEK